MINIIFREGNKHVDPLAVSYEGRLNEFKNIMQEGFVKLVCPNHASKGHATVLIDLALGSSEWDIFDHCCPDFCDEIINEIPYPWNHAPRLKWLDSAA